VKSIRIEGESSNISGLAQKRKGSCPKEKKPAKIILYKSEIDQN